MVESHFNAAHNLRSYKGKCEKLHGHNWKVQIFLQGTKLNNTGMIMDFGKIKEKIQKITQKLDHTYLNSIPPFNKINPTSENLAQHIYKKMNSIINNKQCFISKVTVWETEKNCASYYMKDTKPKR